MRRVILNEHEFQFILFVLVLTWFIYKSALSYVSVICEKYFLHNRFDNTEMTQGPANAARSNRSSGGTATLAG